MNFSATYHSYKSTNAFSKLAIDYIDDEPSLQKFYNHKPDINGIKSAIDLRRKISTNRQLLVNELEKQYQTINTSNKVKENISALLDGNTFTICTAHQPSIFTGHLYFIYKIIHAIKLADELNETITGTHFVPVYYMGSEDADLEELGHVNVNGVQHKWQTSQKGAVGRMKVDKSFLILMDDIEKQLMAEPFGVEIISSIKSIYTEGKTIEQATFEFVNSLFESFGLIILMPDNSSFKNEFTEIVKDELLNQHSHKIVAETISSLPSSYKIQTSGREINLFYLKDDLRERIEFINDEFIIVNTAIKFTKNEILEEVNNYPERFSANVILRPLFQEMLLPNIAFIGGGGELAYWMELKTLFDFYKIPYPVLILRNSFSVIEKRIADKIKKLNLSASDFFLPSNKIHEKLAIANAKTKIGLEEERIALEQLYVTISKAAANVDGTLQNHSQALYAKSLKGILALEKKMLKAEKKKSLVALSQIEKIKNSLYPSAVLQERTDNLLLYSAKYGASFISGVYKHSKSLQQEFCVIVEV